MKSSKDIRLSIIIPAYNEEKTIGIVLDKLRQIELVGVEKEIIVVDDGSKDKTSSIVAEKQKRDKNLQLISQNPNQGKGVAVSTGIDRASGEILLIQDADLEYNPEDIPRLLKPILDKKAQVVYGTRLRTKIKLFGKDKTPLPFHFIGNRFLSFTTTILFGETISDMETGYKVFTRKSIEGINFKSHSFDFEPEITAKILKKGIKILELDIKIIPRGYDEGKKIRPVKDGLIALWTLVKYRFVS
jgi:glycosyltransferase involved in cell wall biosynthesis